MNVLMGLLLVACVILISTPRRGLTSTADEIKRSGLVDLLREAYRGKPR